MPKVLLVSGLDTMQPYVAQTALRALGIESDILFVVSSASYRLLTPVAGITAPFNPTSSQMRDFLKRYQAVLVCWTQSATTTFTGYDPTLTTWLSSWNAADDPPVVHFGAAISTSRTLSLPANFPIIPFDSANPDSTAYRWANGIFTTAGGFRNRIGTRVSLTRENRTVYVRAWNYRWSSDNECAAYLVDQNLLSSESEILAMPDFPDAQRLNQPPTGKLPVFGLRYRNHYLLPALQGPSSTRWSSRHSSYNAFHPFWLLYALKLAGIQPVRKLPVVFEFDHPAEVSSSNPYVSRELDMVRAMRETFEWVRDFAKARGLQILWSSRTGARYETVTGYWWDMLFGTGDAPFDPGDGAAGRAEAQRILQLIQQNPDCFAFGVHDHTGPSGDGFNAPAWGSLARTRHSDPGYEWAAPNPLPIWDQRSSTQGYAINRKVAPTSASGFNFEMNGQAYVLVNAPTTTQATATVPAGSYFTACMLLERALAEHALLGLPIDGGVGYTNHAGNRHGGRGWWEAWRRFGFKGFRWQPGAALELGAPNGDPRRLRYRDLDFVPTANLDFSLSWAGLYHSAASYADTALGRWGLENGTELRGANNEWSNDMQWRREKGVVALRRWLSAAIDSWLFMVLAVQGTGYVHPNNSALHVRRFSDNGWDPIGDWLEGFPGNQVWTGVFNPTKELLVEMDSVIAVLSDYLKWGTIRELMQVRSEVG